MVWAIDFHSLTGNILNGVHSGHPTRMSSKMGEAFDEIYSLLDSNQPQQSSLDLTKSNDMACPIDLMFLVHDMSMTDEQDMPFHPGIDNNRPPSINLHQSLHC